MQVVNSFISSGHLELERLESEIQQQLKNERKFLTFIDARYELSLASERRVQSIRRGSR